MHDPISRREWLTIMSAAGASAALPPGVSDASPATARVASLPVLPLTSTSDVFIPGRGRGFMKFSFDFPEPSVEFEGYRFGLIERAMGA